MTLTSTIPAVAKAPKQRLLPNLTEILYMGLEDARVFKPLPTDVLVSIRTEGDQIADFAGYAAVIRVETPQEDYWHGGREKLMALGQKFAKDLLEHRQAPRLIVHCQYGEIRSKSVANVLSQYFQEPGLPEIPVKTYVLRKLFPDQKKRHAKTGKVKIIPGPTSRELTQVANDDAPDSHLASCLYYGLSDHFDNLPN